MPCAEPGCSSLTAWADRSGNRPGGPARGGLRYLMSRICCNTLCIGVSAGYGGSGGWQAEFRGTGGQDGMEPGMAGALKRFALKPGGGRRVGADHVGIIAKHRPCGQHLAHLVREGHRIRRHSRKFPASGRHGPPQPFQCLGQCACLRLRHRCRAQLRARQQRHRDHRKIAIQAALTGAGEPRSESGQQRQGSPFADRLASAG